MKYWVKLGIKYLCCGVSWGCTVLVFSCLAAYTMDRGAYFAIIMEDFARHAMGAMIVGVACGGTALVYQIDRLSTLAQFTIHFGIGMGCFYPVALYLGWIPLLPGQILYTISQFLVSCGIFVAVWLCFYLFNRSDAREINRRLQEMEREERESTE